MNRKPSLMTKLVVSTLDNLSQTLNVVSTHIKSGFEVSETQEKLTISGFKSKELTEEAPHENCLHIYRR